MAFRIITNSTRECYRCLGKFIVLIFKEDLKILYQHLSQMDRALHNSVMGPKNKKIEIQFRSNIMDQIADYGVASHWKYKDPKIKEKDAREYKWIHDLVDSMNSSVSQDELIQNSKLKVFKMIFLFLHQKEILLNYQKCHSIDFVCYTQSNR